MFHVKQAPSGSPVFHVKHGAYFCPNPGASNLH